MIRERYYVFTIALTLFSAVALQAQQGALGYNRVSCLKVQPGKQAEFTQFESDVAKKLEQAEVDEGDFTSWQLWRVVFPTGEEARCDYIAVISYPGPPPAPRGPEHMGSLL